MTGAVCARARTAVGRAVAEGLLAEPKSLPPWLFYDERGSSLFEAITELPEYYLTRAERSIFHARADEIVAAAARDVPGAAACSTLKVVELGAGTATKSQILLSAVVRRQGRCLYVPVDVSDAALQIATMRLATEEPAVDVRPLAVRHQDALVEVERLGPRRLVLFIGSSIGNFNDEDASDLLRGVRGSLVRGGALLLGADRKKDPARLLAAYDDDQGVTAAFNRNVLVRLNRELDARFPVDRFAHRARWNARASRVEMHLESTCAQEVPIHALGVTVRFAAGETIHTESSHKYDDDHLDRLLSAAGFVRERSWLDDDELFGVHLARAV